MKQLLFLKNLNNSYNQLTPRDQKILKYGVLISVLIIAFKFVFVPLFSLREDTMSKIKHDTILLNKIVKTINSKGRYEKELARMKKSKESNIKQLLTARDSDLASAQLIKTVRSLANRAGIKTSRISATKSHDKDSYFQDISINVPSLRCNMKQLYQLLVNIEKSPFLLNINEMRIRVTNMRNPAEISVNLSLTGYLLQKEETAPKKGKS